MQRHQKRRPTPISNNTRYVARSNERTDRQTLPMNSQLRVCDCEREIIWHGASGLSDTTARKLVPVFDAKYETRLEIAPRLNEVLAMSRVPLHGAVQTSSTALNAMEVFKIFSQLHHCVQYSSPESGYFFL